MNARLQERWAGVRRAGRLVLRQVRYGTAPWSEEARSARARALAELFKGVNGWLGASGVEYLIVYGTLLGWQREGRILLHDRDVDFGVPESAFDVLWSRRSELPAGFCLEDTSWRHGGPKLYVTYRGWEADIYFFREEDDFLRTILVSDIPSDTRPFPKAWFYPRNPVTFLGEPTFVPRDPTSYLTHLYGYLGPDAVRDRKTGYFKPRHGSR